MQIHPSSHAFTTDYIRPNPSVWIRGIQEAESSSQSLSTEEPCLWLVISPPWSLIHNSLLQQNKKALTTFPWGAQFSLQSPYTAVVVTQHLLQPTLLLQPHKSIPLHWAWPQILRFWQLPINPKQGTISLLVFLMDLAKTHNSNYCDIIIRLERSKVILNYKDLGICININTRL